MKILFKIGGTLVDDRAQSAGVAEAIASAAQSNDVAVVHGGGKQLTRFLEDHGIQSRFINGLRVTTPETIDAVVKVLAGSVNKQLVAAFRRAGANPVGLSGFDGNLTTSIALSPELGLVGHVEKADATLITTLHGSGFLPVIACISGNASGSIFNINADRMASALARAWHADRLIYLTDVAGVLDASGTLIPHLTLHGAADLVRAGVAKGGMQAKLDAAAEAVSGGVRSVTIAAGAAPGIIARLLAKESAGTEIIAVPLKSTQEVPAQGDHDQEIQV